MPTPLEYIQAASDAYFSSQPTNTPPGWTVLATSTTSSGMQAVAFMNPQTNEIMISYQGTTTGMQKATDAMIGLQMNTGEANDASDFAREIAAANPESTIYPVGYSLGGYLSQYVAWQGSNPSDGGPALNIIGGANFGGPGVPGMPANFSLPDFTIDPAR